VSFLPNSLEKRPVRRFGMEHNLAPSGDGAVSSPVFPRQGAEFRR
jgi:hypothetical protein